jgi:hypothetical protein
MAVDALKEDGHEVIDLCVIPINRHCAVLNSTFRTRQAPPLAEVLNIGYNLGFGDACQQIASHLIPGEPVNAALQDIIKLVR